MKKFLISVIISFGLLCSPIPISGIVYNCSGNEVFPIFYASPFIYKSTSLSTSLAYDFYFVGFIASFLTWYLLLFAVRLMFIKTILKSGNKIVHYSYNTIKYLVIAYSVFSIVLLMTIGGNTIKSHINIDNEASEWGMKCKGEFYILNYD